MGKTKNHFVYLDDFDVPYDKAIKLRATSLSPLFIILR